MQNVSSPWYETCRPVKEMKSGTSSRPLKLEQPKEHVRLGRKNVARGIVTAFTRCSGKLHKNNPTMTYSSLVTPSPTSEFLTFVENRVGLQPEALAKISAVITVLFWKSHALMSQASFISITNFIFETGCYERKHANTVQSTRSAVKSIIRTNIA